MLTELTLLGAEEAVIHAINWLKLMIEAVGAVVIGMGLVAALASWSPWYASAQQGHVQRNTADTCALPGPGSRTATWSRYSFYSRVTYLGSNRQTSRNCCHTYSA